MKRWAGYLLFWLCVMGVLSSCHSDSPREKETPVAPADRTQIEPPEGSMIAQGLWWMYHLEYDKSREVLTAYIQANPKDPLGYFYRTANGWWQLAQDIELEQPKVFAQFEKDYEDTVRVSQSYLKNTDDPKTQALALLCEGGAKGLMGRWHVTQDNWRAAYSLGKQGNRLLSNAVKLDPDLNDAYLGLGIFDYYTATLPGVKGFFAKIIMGGNKTRGLERLKRTVAKGTYARVEAKLFLIQIYTTFEDKPKEALSLAKFLREEFPHSPAMHAAEITALYAKKDWNNGIAESNDFIDKCRNESPFYSKSNLKMGLYFAGLGTLLGKKDANQCIIYMNQIVSETSEPSQWASFSYLKRGQAYDVLGKRELAKKDYKTVLKRKDVWKTHKQASKSLRRPYSLQGEI